MRLDSIICQVSPSKIPWVNPAAVLSSSSIQKVAVNGIPTPCTTMSNPNYPSFVTPPASLSRFSSSIEIPAKGRLCKVAAPSTLPKETPELATRFCPLSVTTPTPSPSPVPSIYRTSTVRVVKTPSSAVTQLQSSSPFVSGQSSQSFIIRGANSSVKVSPTPSNQPSPQHIPLIGIFLIIRTRRGRESNSAIQNPMSPFVPRNALTYILFPKRKGNRK
jgi:hypothetical protein